MPSKYRIRNYQENSFYHIYNKGVGKNNLFLDDHDYETFLYYLEVYLSPSATHKLYPSPSVQDDKNNIPKRLLSKNLSHDVELIAYLLLPDHFHLVLKQKSSQGISKLIKQLINGYTFYFNNKYKNSGSLFAGKFKSIKVDSENLINVTKYIHSHPGILWLADNYKSYPWSSYKTYLTSSSYYLNKNYLLSNFQSIKDFEKFTQENNQPNTQKNTLLIDN